MAEYTEHEIAATIDHAILKPDLTRDEVNAELDIAREWGVFSVCVRPSDIAYAVNYLQGSSVAVGTVIGFPHGTTSTAAKVAEAQQALEDGATELDMVLNIGWLRSGLDAEVEADIRAVVDTADGVIVKVIFETAYLDDEQIVRACALTAAAGADFVKTSTGSAGGGATVDHIRLMRANTDPRVQVKASGGVRGLESAIDMLDAGATRLGTSASSTILGAARRAASGESGESGVDSSSY